MTIYTLKECSDILKISIVTIRRMISNNKFCKTKRIGGQIRVLDSDFFAWIESQEDISQQYSNVKNRRFVNKMNRLNQ